MNTTTDTLYEMLNALTQEDMAGVRDMLDSKLTAPQTSIAGKTFVLTGKLSITRKQMTEIIKRHGGNCMTTVNKHVDYLLVGERPGSKYSQGRYYNVPTLTEDEFYALLGE